MGNRIIPHAEITADINSLLDKPSTPFFYVGEYDKGYPVFRRAGKFLTAVFAIEADAEDYVEYRNAMTVRHYDDCVPIGNQ